MRWKDWLGAAVTIVSAAVEHLLGETAAVAALTAAVVLAVGVLWRRVSVLMAAPRANNCTKAYAVEDRLVNYMQLMEGLAPIANANTGGITTNATFLAALAKLPHQTTSNSSISNSNGNLSSGDAAAINGVIAAVNNLQTNLQSNKFES